MRLRQKSGQPADKLIPVILQITGSAAQQTDLGTDHRFKLQRPSVPLVDLICIQPVVIGKDLPLISLFTDKRHDHLPALLVCPLLTPIVIFLDPPHCPAHNMMLLL